MRFDKYISLFGWIELFKYIVKNGVFKLKAGYSYVLDGLLSDDRGAKPVYSKILKRLVPKPWATQPVTLATEPLVKLLDAKQLQEVEDAHKVSWKKWFGNGWGGEGQPR